MDLPPCEDRSCAICGMSDPDQLLPDDLSGFWMCGDCEKHWDDFGDDDMIFFPGEVEEILQKREDDLVKAAEWLELMRQCQEDRYYILGEPDYNPALYDDVFE